MENFVIDIHQPALDFDANIYTDPMSSYEDSPEGVQSLFNYVSYFKCE